MKTPIPLPLKGDCLFIDNSSMTSYMSCPRLGAYSYSLKRKPANASPALIFGAAIHEALEVRYRNHHDKPIVTPEVFDDMVTALMDYYDEHGTELDIQEYRNVSYGISTLSEYTQKYKYEPLTTVYLDNEPCVEIPFALLAGQFEINKEIWVTDPDLNDGAPTLKHIDTIKVYLTGKIDMIVTKGASKYIFDHKTTSMGGAGFFDEFYTATQFKGYIWAAQQLIGEDIRGVIINALMCRKPKRDGSINYDFERATIPIHQDHVDEWHNTFLLTVTEFIQQHVDQDSFDSGEQSFPMNTMWCKGKYGKCKFYDVCTLRPSQREFMLFSNVYVDDTWSPIKEEERVNLGQNEHKPPTLPNIFPLD